MKTALITLGATCALATGVAMAASGFFIQGAQLTRQPDGSWTGPGTLDGVTGTLTITGKIDPLNPDGRRHKIHFKWTAGKRLVAGCSYEEFFSRPYDRQLWAGDGQITKTSKQERKYQRVHVGVNGVTNRADPQHAKISVRAHKESPTFPARDC
jgi:hypothetical protein